MRLTEEQAEKMGLEYNLLMVLAQTQLEEYKISLQCKLHLLGATEEVDLVKDVALGFITVDPAIKEGEKPTITVVYEYPDALHAYLSKPGLPPDMSLTAQGGITLEEKPSVVKA